MTTLSHPAIHPVKLDQPTSLDPVASLPRTLLASPRALGDLVGDLVGEAFGDSLADRLGDSLDTVVRRPLRALRRRARLARVDRAAAAGRPIVLGDASCPYEALPARHELLERIEPLSGLSVLVRSRCGSAAVDDAERFAQLDRDHAVTVELQVPGSSVLPQPTHLEAARRLAARGLTVRLVLPVAAAARRLLPTLRDAHAAGVHDIALVSGAPAAATRRLDRLRFESGFPQPLPSRG